MLVDFYKNFAKRLNSTTLPNSPPHIYSAYSRDCVLKQPFTVENPDILISESNADIEFNYCYIKDFKRYYYIVERKYIGNRWQYSLETDVLATYREVIGSSNQFVIRSSAKSDGRLIDDLYPVKAKPIVIENAATPVINPFPETIRSGGGTYVVGVISDSPLAVGGVAYYAMDSNNIRSFYNLLLGSSEWAYSGISEISNELFKSLFNPMQYLVSCTWYPINNAFSGGKTDVLHYGWYSFTGFTNLRLLDNLNQSWNTNFNITMHSDSVTYGEYLNYEPYSRSTIIWPVFGTIPINRNLIGNSNVIAMRGVIDATTGVSTIYIDVKEPQATLYTGSGQVGIPVQLNQISSNVAGTIGDVVGSAVKFATGNAIGGASGIISAIDNLIPEVGSKGGNGGTAIFQLAPKIRNEFLVQTKRNNNIYGRPLCQTVKLSEIPGYIKTDVCDLQSIGNPEEKSVIERYMRDGFYYE